MFRLLLLWLVLLPLQTGLLIIVGLAEMMRGIRALFSGRPAAVQPPIARSGLCSIVVLNWNGKHLLEESLPDLLAAVRHTGKDHEVLVVDNGSTDGSVAWLQASHPDVRVLALDRNYGFGEGNNRGVEAASHDIVILLNNDMLVDERFIEPLLDGFGDPDAFGVSCQVFFPEGRRREETGNTQAELVNGYLHVSHQDIEPYHYSRKHLPVFWAGGGASAFDRQKFLSLGGFSKLFSPCYFEDTDISYRAWRRGWKCLLAADSRVLHKHRSSSTVRFQPKDLGDLVEERRLLYLWKNFPLSELIGHFLLLPFHLRSKVSMRAYLRAVRRLPAALLERFREPRALYTYRQVSEWVSHPLRYLDRFFPDRTYQGERSRGPLRILYVTAYLPHLGYHGGAGRVFQLLVRVAKAAEVHLASFVETRKEREEVEQVRPHCQSVEVIERNEYDPVSLFPYEPFEEFNSPDFRKALESVLTERDFDLIHYEWTQMVQFADLAPNTPSLVTEIEVNYAAEQSRARLERNPWRRVRQYYNTLQTLYREIEMCRRVDKVITVTDVDRDFLSGYLPDDQLAVINTGVDVDYFEFAEPAESDPDAVVFVGAFRHQPNVDGILWFCREIFPTILKKRPATQLYIVGSSPPEQIRRLESDSIVVTGFVQDIRDYYRRARVVVVPLRTGVGIRGKILEGWSAGRPMVATSVACLGIEAVHGENIMVADDPREFADWTLALLRNPRFCNRLALAGRRLAESRYDWSAVSLQLLELYRTMVPGAEPKTAEELVQI